MAELKPLDEPNKWQGRYEHDWDGLVVTQVVSVAGVQWDISNASVVDISLNGNLHANVWFADGTCRLVQCSEVELSKPE